VRDAFKVGLGFRDERIDNLFDAATEEGILPDNLLQVVHFDHHHVSIGVTATGEVGEIPKPVHQFKVEGNPKKPITKLVFRFCEEVRDAGNPIPSAGDFLLWVHSARPTEPYITIQSVTGQHLVYAENWALNDPIEYDLNAIRARIDAYCAAI
jgi:hypothetical protein